MSDEFECRTCTIVFILISIDPVPAQIPAAGQRSHAGTISTFYQLNIWAMPPYILLFPLENFR
jgi:hypothetical protein